MSDENVMETGISAVVTGTVQCHYPCVPECPREHEWENPK